MHNFFIAANFALLISMLQCSTPKKPAAILSTNQQQPTAMNITPNDSLDNQNLQVATLGGGCFWCIEAVYQELEGVDTAMSGYAGGIVPNPTYKEVCTGNTQHAEVVQIIFNPKVISYADILDVFWHVHDPTTLNRQGNDVGTQYRSVIFYHNESQRQIAEQSLQQAQSEGIWNAPFVTQIVPYTEFFKAEDYHQGYYQRVGDENSYCTFVISPKVAKFRKKYSDKLKN